MLPCAQASPEELAEAREVLVQACRSDEQAPPPPLPSLGPLSPASSSPPSIGRMLLVQRALNPASAERSSGPAGSFFASAESSGNGLGMRRVKSGIFSSAATSASLTAWGGKGSGSAGHPSMNEDISASLLLSLMSVSSDVGDSTAAAIAAAAAAAVACGYGPGGSTASGEEDAEVQQCLLEMLMGRRAQAPVSDGFRLLRGGEGAFKPVIPVCRFSVSPRIHACV